MWRSRSFQAQLLAGVFNWSQLHAIGSLNWDKGNEPTFSPIQDPGNQTEEIPAEEMSVFDIHKKLSASRRG